MPDCHVVRITAAQAGELRELLEGRGWRLGTAPYARWRARLGSVDVVAYESGKLTVQGRGMDEFIRFTLEPEILHEARYGYEEELAEQEHPEMFQPHAGIDESGKGDYFGPLCVACCFTDGDAARALRKAGVADSKTIGSDARIAALAEVVRRECAGRHSVVALPPETYNRLYGSFGNLNRLLAWGHARSLENLLEKVPECPRAISDQFGNPAGLRRALQERGRRIVLEQHPRAERDVAVAAASILARDEFVRRIAALEARYGLALPKGAGPGVLVQARRFVERHGAGELARVAKLHFKTTLEVGGPSA